MFVQYSHAYLCVTSNLYMFIVNLRVEACLFDVKVIIELLSNVLMVTGCCGTRMQWSPQVGLCAVQDSLDATALQHGLSLSHSLFSGMCECVSNYCIYLGKTSACVC